MLRSRQASLKEAGERPELRWAALDKRLDEPSIRQFEQERADWCLSKILSWSIFALAGTTL
jgi:hypothetical protein